MEAPAGEGDDIFGDGAFPQGLGPPQGSEDESSDSEVDFPGKLLGPSDEADEDEVEGSGFAAEGPVEVGIRFGAMVQACLENEGEPSVYFAAGGEGPVAGGGEGAREPVAGEWEGADEPVAGIGEGANELVVGTGGEVCGSVAGGGKGPDPGHEPGPSSRPPGEDSGSMGSFMRGAKLLARGRCGSPTRGANLDDLSEDLLIKILATADLCIKELCTYSTVCRKWKRVCYGPSLWERVTLGREVNNCTLHKIAKRCSNLIELRIEKVQKIHGLRSVFRACGHSLKRLKISWESNSGSGFAFLVLWMVSRDCRELDTVELTSSARSAYSMGLEYGPIWCLTVGCQSMRTFIDYCGRSTTDNTLNLIGRAWKDLTTLAIHGTSFTMRGLIQLRGCTKLQSLEICDGKPGLIGDAQEPRQPGFMLHDTLHRVTFTRTQLTTDEVKLLYRSCPSLKRVEIKALSITVAGVGEDAQLEQQQVKKRVADFIALNGLPAFKARGGVVHAEP